MQSILHELVESAQHWAALSPLTYLGQPGITEGNVIHSQIQEDLISKPDAGKSGQGIW